MDEITLRGNPIHTSGDLPAIGADAPDFVLTKTDLSDVSKKDFAGKRVILNIFPSLDTPVCATSVRRFNEDAATVDNAEILCVSMDLPFAHNRFCTAEGLDKVTAVSELRNRSFGEGYGVGVVDGPMAGLFARAVVVLDEKGKVVYTELVPEIAQEPDYEKALAALK